MRRPRTLVTAALALSVVLVSACGSDDDTTVPLTGNPPTTQPTTSSGAASAAVVDTGIGTGDGTPTNADESAFPVTVDAANGSVELAAAPHRIVSLSPTATEMLYAIGAGSQVVAVDGESDYPAGTPGTDLSAYTPDVDAIAAQQPDLVLVYLDNDDVVAGLGARAIPVLELPAAEKLDDTYAQLTALGKATGHIVEAAAVADRMRTEIDALVAQVPARQAPVRIFHEIDDDLFTATSATLLGQLYRMAGFENIADDPANHTRRGDGYPQLSADEVRDENPAWIFVAHHLAGGGGDLATALADRSGWSDVRAVRSHQVVGLDPEIASRWGPRTVDLLRSILESTAAAGT
jgi:iron complex transport system substrate-binding protein